jgi:hypothetical protein
MWLMWVFTVASDTNRAAAISAFDSPAAQRLEQPALHGRVELRVAGRHVGDRAQDLVRARVLGQEAAGAGRERGEDPGVVGVRGQHDDQGVRPQAAQPLGGLDAVAARHVQVHQGAGPPAK